MIEIKNRFNGEVILTVDGDSLREANLRGADLRGADLRGADLCEADLCWADLRGADLCGADLCWADLRGADLRGADLCGANLRGANLRGADLRGANLRGAGLVIYGLTWHVQITKNHMRIGCQAHDITEWESFTDEQIDDMDSSALEFWKENKAMLLGLCQKFKGE